jgi:hypothetical protein
MTDDNVVSGASPTAQHLYRSLLTPLRPIGPFPRGTEKNLGASGARLSIRRRSL